MLNVRRFIVVCVVILLLVAGIGWFLNYLINRYSPRDWPTWRYDTMRSASSPQRLPDKLHLQWVREYPKLTQAWENPLNQDLMQFDKVYEPIVHGKTMFIGSNASDRMIALDTETGEEKWALYVGGPVRFPPVAADGKVYFVSDDGHLYCVDAEQGKIIWKFRGGPSDRKILGNERIISTWPARGGPVLKDDTVYFAAGIWPFMGTFIYALDAETGKVVWENDSTGPIYMKQPHNSPSYAGVAPQGTLVISGDKLLIPCGRSAPACFDRHTGELLYYQLSQHNKTGGAFVCANKDYFVNYHRDYATSLYDLATGNSVIRRFGKIPVMTEKALFSMGESVIAYDLENMGQFEDERIDVNKDDLEAKIVRSRRWSLRQLWSIGVDASGDLIKAGKRLYAGGDNVVSAVRVPRRGKKPEVMWKTRIAGKASRIIAADNKLFVVTLEGDIYAFGRKKTEPKVYTYKSRKSKIAKAVSARADAILKTTEVMDGYCLAYGLEEGELVEAIARKSNLRIIAVDPDPAKVDRLRRKFDAVGLYGKRITVQLGDPFRFEAPPYLASLTIFENLESAGYKLGEPFLKRIYHSIRPYGGIACLPVSGDEMFAVVQQIEESDLPGAKLHKVEPDDSLLQGLRYTAGSERSEGYLLLSREGQLAGAADWTHQYGDIANTVKSDDQRVKLPLGILWFGGSSNADVLPRHGHGPPEQVIGGRLFIEGIDSLNARDVYTGRVLWKRTISDLDTYGTYYGETYANTPLSTSYSQIHIPGANARSTNFVATLDKVYIIKKGGCLVLDPETGKTIDEFKLPLDPRTGSPADWGYIGVYKDYLIAGAGFVHYLDFLEFDELGDPNTTYKRRVYYNFDITSSKKLVVMDRHTGKILWSRDSQRGFRHNAIAVGDDKIFCIDTIPPPISDALKRRLGEYRFGDPELIALDVGSGKVVWSTDRDIAGTWLSYSEEYDVLLQSRRPSRDMIRGETGKGMTTYRGRDGRFLWSNDSSRGGPYILHGEKIITDRNAYNLLTGEEEMRVDPLTGEEAPWAFRRNYGCNYVIASENLLTFRSAAAGFYDLMRDGGTGNFGGFKTGCTSNLVIADGVLNAPEYTRTCSCSYPNQTSLAMVYMPEVEIWTDYTARAKSKIVESSSVAIAIFGEELTHANNLFVKMWEYDDRKDILGKSAAELWQADENSMMAVQAVRDGGQWKGELVAVKEDGSTRDVYVSVTAITDEAGEIISAISSAVRITNGATAFFDLGGSITYADNSFLRLWGYDNESDILGKSATEFWQSEKGLLGILRILSDQGSWKGEVLAVREDASTMDVYLSANMIADKAGKPASIVASFVDITELKEVEEAVTNLKSLQGVVAEDVPIRSIGINLGAPGDRKADNGTLWLEYPVVGGPSPKVPVSIDHRKLLFSVDSEFQTELDDKSISEELRQEFGKRRIPLSQIATVSIKKKNSEWLIARSYGNTYTIRKEEDRLNIYEYERFYHHSSKIQGDGLKWVVSSGVKGVSSVTIALASKPSEDDQDVGEEQVERAYTVRLYFSEPDDIAAGQRVFDISIQGKKVLGSFDIIEEAGGPNRSVVKEYSGVLVKHDLAVDLSPSNSASENSPLICGIEVLAEGW